MGRLRLFLLVTVLAWAAGCTAPAGGPPHVSPADRPAPTPTSTQAAVAGTPPAPAPTEWAFTRAGQQPEALLAGVMRAARSSLDVAVYSLTQPDIVRAMSDAKRRGVAVRVITDALEARNHSQARALKSLRDAGIPIKVNSHRGLMHLKITIADASVVTTGSYNYTTAASTTNDEVLVVLRYPEVARAWATEFERLWGDAAEYRPLE